ncbi:GreA/GreB family elongation factor [Hydrogenophaga sp.]|uniref:GreA/GreB family elongation factor n=1 Tax=Hydrogenophaga sp. TaxID=1904254 RepID=UPI00272571D9|nr:GreA/GreB family elongation factor [Hydrogenophaga sp.]MDO8904984.1 GreA/GreB family elongation factor [Hydrogenophaga sp.]
MNLKPPAERLLTELDFARLNQIDSGDPPSALEQVLAATDLVASRAVPADVLTMYSQVVLEDPASLRQQTFTLCYPADAEPAEGFISVLSPLGAALIGLRVGDVARWTTPDGKLREAQVLGLLFQPEASGDYVT